MVRDVHFRIKKMECLVESMSADPFKHRQELLERLDILRNNDSFCDVTISVKSKEFRAHRAVLAAASPFFLTLLTSNMKESNEQLIKVELEEATESVMEDALKYLYTGNVTVVEERAHNLIATANYLLLPSLKTMAGNILKEAVSTENCLFNYYFAEKYECVELKEKCRKVINSNFSFVMETEDFLNLDVKQVMEWVLSDDVIVNAEEDIFQGIVKWVSHNKSEREDYFLELLSQVRMTSVSQDFLLNQLPKEELVISNSKIGLNFVLDAMKRKLSETDERAIQQPRKCLSTHIEGIFLCGGRKTLCYFPQKNIWYRMPDTLFEHDHSTFTPAEFMHKIYIFDVGSHKFDESTAKVMEYLEDNNTWAAAQGAAASIDITHYTVLNGDLYALHLQYHKTDIYRYDAETNDWDGVESLAFGQRDACIVTDEQFLYIIGGRDTSRTSRYDSRDTKLEELACVNKRRCDAFGAAMNGKIYIGGGTMTGLSLFGHNVHSSCEVYNPATNEWQLMPSLKVPRCSASMVHVQGRLYVLGGTSVTESYSHTRALTVEMFDSERNEWKEISQIPVERFESQEEMKKGKRFKACCASLSKKVINKRKPLS